MFSSAIKYLQQYRWRRADAQANKKRMAWFSADAGTFKALLSDTFSSTDENAEWAKLAAAKDTTFPVMHAVRLKIAFLANCRHDLRNQFAVGAEHEGKTALDFDRHAVNELGAAYYRLALLDRMVKIKAAGIAPNNGSGGA